jgi:hopanoid biosynthesis associated RND transporter like protein HpnN
MPLIHRILQRMMGLVARLVCARPGAVLMLGLLLTVASICVVTTRFNVINNTTDLLSDKSEAKKNYNEMLHDFGSDYRYIVLIKSPDQAKNREAANEIGPYLESLKPQISSVLYKIDFSSIKPRLLFTRDKIELEKIANDLESESNLQEKNEKDSRQTALDLNSILDEANDKFDDKYLRKSENWKDFNSFVVRFVSLLNKISAQAEGKTLASESSKTSDGNHSIEDFDADSTISQHEYFSLPDGQTLLVMAYTGEGEKKSSTPFSDTTAKIRQHLKELESKYSGVEMELTGEPALDADEAASSSTDAAKASVLTIVFILALFFFSYRSFLRPAFAFLVLNMAVLWSLGFALVFVGHFNVISIAMIPMVLGIGIDFGIQILGRYEEELGRHGDVNQAVTATLEHTGVAIITGGSTTAAAFFTLCFNDFVGLAELGIIAGASMIFCIAANLVMLPAIFILRDHQRVKEELSAQLSDSSWNFIRSWDRDIVRTPRLWLGLAAVISLISIFSLPELRFDYNLLHLNNPSAGAIKTLNEMMAASTSGHGNQVSTIYASVVAGNLDEARSPRKKLLALPVVARIDSPLDLLSENQDEKIPVIKRIVAAATALNVKPSTGESVDIPRARRDVKSLLDKAKTGQEQAQKYVHLSNLASQAVTAFSAMIPALERADTALNSASIATIQERFKPSSRGAFTRMQANLELLLTQKTDRGLEPSDLPPAIQKLYLAANGKVLLQVYGKKDLWEHKPDEEFTKAVLSVAPKATGTPIMNYFATELLRVSYLWAAVWAFLAIVILITLHFQSFKFLLLTLTPLILAILWRTGVMVWLGIDFNPANIVTLPLIIGIDVAFGVYIVDRYREDGKFSLFSGSTGKAIIMSALTSFFGFISLLISHFRGMYSIGQLMSLGIAIGLVTAVFILPQILILLKPAPCAEQSGAKR